MKKRLIIYISIIVVAIALGISLFFILNPNKKDKNTQIYIYSYDGEEKFVLYDGPELEYYNNGEIRSSYEPSADFYPGEDISKEEFINEYVLKNEYLHSSFEYVYGNGTKETIYEFFYNGYAFYFSSEPDYFYPYLFFLCTGEMVGESFSKGKFIYAICPFNLSQDLCNLSDNKIIDINYSKLSGVDNYEELYNWYKELNNPYITLNDETKEIKILAYDNIQTKEYVDGLYVSITPDDKISLVYEK